MTKKFNIVSDYKPAGDQPKAISEIVAGINAGLLNQTLLQLPALARHSPWLM